MGHNEANGFQEANQGVGGDLPFPFSKIQKSDLTLWKNALAMVILGYISHLKCNFLEDPEEKTRDFYLWGLSPSFCT